MRKNSHWKWRKGGTGGSTLYLGLLWVTAGLAFFLLLMTISAAHSAYSALSSAAQEAAWSGQAMIHNGSQNVGGSQGFFQVGEQSFGSVGTAANQAFQSNVNSLHLSNYFSYTNETTNVQNNQVSVTATGEYDVPWINDAMDYVFGAQGVKPFYIPMSVTATGTN